MLYGDVDNDIERTMLIVNSDDAYNTQLHPLICVHPEMGAETSYPAIGLENTNPEAAVSLRLEVYNPKPSLSSNATLDGKREY